MKLLYEILMKITKETLWFILFKLIQNDTQSVSRKEKNVSDENHAKALEICQKKDRKTVNRRWQRAYNSS